MKRRKIVLIAHNIRSTHNIGSLLRTAEGLGVEQVYISGYSPYPREENEKRLPHLADKIDGQIAKTALGAEHYINWSHEPNIRDLISRLKTRGFKIVGLEQTNSASVLAEFKPPSKVALLIGSEVKGIDKKLLNLCDLHIEIPMSGKKESLNVAVAAGIALHHLRFT